VFSVVLLLQLAIYKCTKDFYACDELVVNCSLHVAGTSGTRLLTPNNTLITAGQNASFRCSSSLGNDQVGWSQVSAVSLGCVTPRLGYYVSCSGQYNELTVLSPATAETYACSDVPSGGSKAAMVILGECSINLLSICLHVAPQLQQI
jgi:hypothetical protein